VVRAILEGAALAIRHLVIPLRQAGIPIRAMVVCGGPAQSRLWNQIKADVTGLSVEVPSILETAVVGSAVAAAVAVGAYPDLPAAIGGMVRIEKVVAPREEHQATYDRLFQAYVALHPAIAPILRPLWVPPVEQPTSPATAGDRPAGVASTTATSPVAP
jgi:xylulokinase